MSGLPPDQGNQAQKAARFALALGLFLLGLYTLQEFLRALVWGSIFVIALWPLYQRLRARTGGRQSALLPVAFTVAVALIFVGPLGLLGFQLARESHAATEWVRQAQEKGIPEPAVLQQIPYAQPALSTWWQANLAEPGSARALLGRVTQGRVEGLGRDLGQQLVRRLTLFAFTIVTIFFLLRDGDVLLAQMRRASRRAFGAGGERIGKQIVASIHGTVNGLVLVGLGEGVVLGAVYAIAGVPHATVFGALTAVAAMIPFAAPVMFGLAALLLLAQGAVLSAVIVFAIGMVVTFVADHFVRPVLIGGTTRLPFLWVLLGILGGVEIWGLIGLFIGPAVMAALIMMWREYAGEGAQSDT